MTINVDVLSVLIFVAANVGVPVAYVHGLKVKQSIIETDIKWIKAHIKGGEK